MSQYIKYNTAKTQTQLFLNLKKKIYAFVISKCFKHERSQ